MDRNSIFFSDSTNPHLSLQEMIEHDIKTEFGGMSCGNTSGNFSNMDTLELLNDLDFNLEDTLLHSHDWNSGLNSYPDVVAPTLNHTTAFGGTDDGTSVMVNPNSVMPLQREPKPQQPLTVNTHFHNSPSYVTVSPVVVNHDRFTNVVAPSNAPYKSIRISPPLASPLQQVPSPSGNQAFPLVGNHSARKKPQTPVVQPNGFPKPAYSYSCLIALALKNSRTGSMSVSEIYNFMCEHFPYFRTAPSGWKNSVRHNLSLNKCFEKIEKPNPNGGQRKGCLWAMNPAKITKMEEEVAKWSRKDPEGIKRGMLIPDNLTALERGEFVKDYSNVHTPGRESEDDEEPRTPNSISSQEYESAGTDFVDVEGFTSITDSSLPEINIPASGNIFTNFDTNNPPILRANYSIMTSGEQKPQSFNTIVFQRKPEGPKLYNV